jgi:hypothetical protein
LPSTSGRCSRKKGGAQEACHGRVGVFPAIADQPAHSRTQQRTVSHAAELGCQRIDIGLVEEYRSRKGWEWHGNLLRQ